MATRVLYLSSSIVATTCGCYIRKKLTPTPSLCVLLLEQVTTRKKREFSVPEFEPGENKEYKVKAIQDSAVYAKKVDGHLLGLYYLIV